MLENRLVFRNFKDDYEERVSKKLFYKFITALFIFYFFLLICSQSFYANYAYVGISGISMQSTLNPNPVFVKTEDGDELMQDGVYLKYTQDVTYGEIVIIKSDLSMDHQSIIKRVIGMEGDYITIAKVDVENGSEYRVMRVKKNSSHVEVLYEDYVKDYTEWTANHLHSFQITVNDVVYQRTFFEEYTNADRHDYKQKTFAVDELDGKEAIFFQVPEGEFFFMGDNRAHSTDARAVGTYSTERIVGKVVNIVENGTKYEGNNVWWWNRMVGFVKICYTEVLRFFGADI